MTKKTILALLLLFAAVSLAACDSNRHSPATQEEAAVGGYAPDFVLKNILGENVKLSQYRGRVVLLEFWATWCPPCKATVPELVALQKEFKDKGFVVLGVSLDDSVDLPEKLSAFVDEHGMNYPVLLGNEAVEKSYRVTSIPMAYLIDRQGKITKYYSGYVEGLQERISSDLGRLI